jgi:hypothetical protein
MSIIIEGRSSPNISNRSVDILAISALNQAFLLSNKASDERLILAFFLASFRV